MNNQISSYQLTAVMLPLILAPMMMNFSRLVFIGAGRGAWLVILGITLGTLLLSAATVGLYRANPVSLPENCVFLWGKKPAELFLLLLALLFLFYSATVLNIGIYTVKMFFLPRTPKFVIGLLLFLPGIAMAYYGFRSYTHMATLLIPALILFLTIFLFTKHNYRPEELFPLGEFQLKKVCLSVPALFMTAPGTVATFIALPYVSDTRQLLGKMLIPALLVLILGLFVYAMSLMYFGGNTLPRLVLPFYNLSSVFKGTLAERMDILFLLTILPTLTVCSSFGLVIAKLILENIFIKTFARHKIVPLMLMSGAVVFGVVFTSDQLPLWTVWEIGNGIALLMTVLLLLLTAAANLKRRRILK